MPSQIPFDKSLILGNIIPKDKINTLLDIANQTNFTGTTENHLNALISLKRHLDTTIQKLIELNIDPSDVQKESDRISKDISDTSIDYHKALLTTQKNLQRLRTKAESTI